MTRLSILMLPLLFMTAPAEATDFGIRMVGQAAAVTMERHVSASIGLASIRSGVFGNVRDAARVAERFGHITSTWRSVEHNRAVGGVPNS